MRKTVKIGLLFLFVTFLSLPVNAGEGTFNVSSTPNIIGSGARALGLGGAFISIADDGTAASWNPAALIILRNPEAAAMVSYEKRQRFGDASFADFNYLAASYPFNFINRNMVISFNYQRLVDFYSELDENFSNLVPRSVSGDKPIFEEIYPGQTWPVYTFNYTDVRVHNFHLIDEVVGDVGAIAPAFAIQLTRKVTFGFTLNFWMDGVLNNGYKHTYKEAQNGTVEQDKTYWMDSNDNGKVDGGEWVDDGDGIPEPGEGETITIDTDSRRFKSGATIETEYDFSGINANIGFLVRATPKLTLGAVYKVPFTANVTVKRNYDSWDQTEDTITGKWLKVRDSGKYETLYKITFPATYGLGGSWKFSDKLKVALDLAYIDYPNFIVQEYVNTGERSRGGMGAGGEYRVAGRRVSAVNGVRTSEADIDAVITARAGMEYLFIMPKTIVPVRFGLMYDPQPAQGGNEDFYGVTAGSGIVLWNKLLFDLAYQYRFGNNATVFTITDSEGSLAALNTIKDDVSQHIFLLSSIYYFK